MAIVLFAVSVTILEIFKIEMCITLILNCRMNQGRVQNMQMDSLYSNIYVGNNNVFPRYHRLPDIHSQNVHGPDLELYNRPHSTS